VSSEERIEGRVQEAEFRRQEFGEEGSVVKSLLK
jgi:hypothetical protein